MSKRSHTHFAPRRGMTLVEAMVVVAIIAALIAILVPALGIIRGQAKLVSSQSNMRNIAAYLVLYAADSRDHVVPSHFNYAGPFVRTQVRSASPDGTNPNVGNLYEGSWTDILWTTQRVGPLMLDIDAGDPPPNPAWDYRFDSPDYWAYRYKQEITQDVFRSTVELKKPFAPSIPDQLPTPFAAGAGQREVGQPGYFAANNFFDSTTGNWYTHAMIKRPSQSLYLVDSRAGETISMTPEAWNPNNLTQCELEFRYIGDMALVLFMDGHVTPEAKWKDLPDLQLNRQIRVERLNEN